MLTIERIDGGGGAEQFEYTTRNPNSLVYSSPRYLRLVADHLNASAGWYVAKRDGIVVGLLPFHVKEGPLGPAFNSLAYYGGNGGVIQDVFDETSRAALVDTFYLEAAKESACSATLITNPLKQDADFYEESTGYTFRDERIGQITHFPRNGNLNSLMERFQTPRPRNIRRALKEGVKVVKGHDDRILDFLHSTHVENIHSIGGLAKHRSFFEAMQRMMRQEDWSVFIATLEGKPIAALLIFYFNKTVEYFTPVVVEQYRNTQALSLAIYEGMVDAMDLGYESWNWGGTWLSQKGVYDFKKRWGTSEYRYYYYTRLFNTALLNQQPSYLLEHYPGFFLAPFENLITEKRSNHA